MLYLAGRYGDDFARDCSIEYTGPLAEAMSLANRVTLADHVVEVGAKFGLFAADEKTAEYVDGAAGVDFDPVVADGDAVYAKEITVDFDEIGFQVAKPFTFDNVVPVGEVAGVRIDQARLGSCANGRFEDIEIAARILKGRQVAKHVKFYVSPASMSVYKQCVDAGVVSTLLEAGVQFDTPGCTICQSPGVVLNEEVCISSTTRNYRGRFGGSTCSEAQLYLAGPATVAASAVAGEIAYPTEYLR
jgi:3-isopropylmalate/(R)-2-methylmalate dehydratase large subunit